MMFSFVWFVFLPSSISLLDILRNRISQMIDGRPLMSHVVVVMHRWAHHLRRYMMVTDRNWIVALMIKSHRSVRAKMKVNLLSRNTTELVRT